MANTYAYMRISTEEERGKQKFTRQENALRKFADENNIDFTLEFKEDKSGKNFTDRKQWQKLESIVQSGDTIVFKDICRFTRECKNGMQKYMELINKGINLIFIDNPTISSDYIKSLANVAETSKDNILGLTMDFIVKLILTVELDRAEKERITTSQRIKDGIAASSKQSGRSKGSLDKMSDELRADIEVFLKDRSIKQVDLMKKYNISRNTLKKYISIINN